jgi:hypothetical protein
MCSRFQHPTKVNGQVHSGPCTPNTQKIDGGVERAYSQSGKGGSKKKNPWFFRESNFNHSRLSHLAHLSMVEDVSFICSNSCI